MHNAGFKALGIDAEYRSLEIPSEREVDAFIQSLHASGYAGFNVTVPYKTKFITEVKDVYCCSDESVRAIGAVNTVTLESGFYCGYNTDWYGFLKALAIDLSFSPAGKTALLIGTGGAGKACLYALLKSKAHKVVISDKDLQKAFALRQHYATSGDFSSSALEVIEPENIAHDLQRFDLIVNATTCGMHADDPELIAERDLAHTSACVYDLIYNPAETKLVNAARAHGLNASNGLMMLLYQGVRAFELWTGHDAPVDVMKKALLAQLSH